MKMYGIDYNLKSFGHELFGGLYSVLPAKYQVIPHLRQITMGKYFVNISKRVNDNHGYSTRY